MQNDGQQETYQPPKDPAVWLIYLVYFGLAVIFSYVMLLGHAPDETSRHLPYVRWLAETWSLPVGDLEVEHGALELHPPLYYLLLTPVYLAAEVLKINPLRLLRWTSPFLILASIYLWQQVIWRATGRKRALFLFSFALTAWWPNIFVDAGALNNDVGAILASALLLYLAAVYYWDDRSLKSAVVLGVIAGIAALMKASTIATSVGMLGVMLAWQHWDRLPGDRKFWLRGFSMMGAFFAIAGWWYVRNYALYGAFTPYPRGYSPIPEGLSRWDAISTGMVWPLALRAINGLWASVWAGMAWIPPAAGPVVYTVLRIITVAALIGLAARIIRWRREGAADAEIQAIVLPLVGFVTLVVAAVWMSVFVHMGVYQGGRYLLIFLPGLTIPLAYGLHELYRRVPRYVLHFVTVGFFLLLSPLALYHIATYWNPTVQNAAAMSGN
ncbi:MAG: hypothetical protein ACLFWB_13880 [Armatimonadota bacterium]